MARLNMFRWLHGLDPVVDDTTSFDRAMACAVVGAYNPPGQVPNPHEPPVTATCYSALGASGAGSSNMAWGSVTVADAMDDWVQDRGNETTLGHRRWILNPSLGRTAIGFYAGGGPYGSAACMSVFDGSGQGPSPEWVSFPPAGFAPLETLRWAWSVHLREGNASAGQIVVRRRGDGQPLGFRKLPLSQGFGSYSTVGFQPEGWQPAAGESYDVTFTSGTLTRTWSVTALGC